MYTVCLISKFSATASITRSISLSFSRSLSYVQGPMILSVRNFKDEIKQQLRDKYSHFEPRNKMFMNEFSKSPWPNAKEKIVNYLNSLGKHRNIDWTKIWGTDWIENYV